MPRHVLDHYNRVIDENADRKDEREERDAIQRVAIEIEDGESQRERHWNRCRHDS